MRLRLLTVMAAATIVVRSNQTSAETPSSALANPVSHAPALASAPAAGRARSQRVAGDHDSFGHTTEHRSRHAGRIGHQPG